ncbi:MAG: hypothetical protein QOJ40_1216 [Verrucomicrobiota bacterium]
MRYRKTIVSVTAAAALLTASGSFAADPDKDSSVQKDKVLTYPLSQSDREILQKRIARIEPGMTVNQALQVLKPMRGFPHPVWNIPGDNSLNQNLGNGWSLHLEFAKAEEGGLLISAKLNPPVEPQQPEKTK